MKKRKSVVGVLFVIAIAIIAITNSKKDRQEPPSGEDASAEDDGRHLLFDVTGDGQEDLVLDRTSDSGKNTVMVYDSDNKVIYRFFDQEEIYELCGTDKDRVVVRKVVDPDTKIVGTIELSDGYLVFIPDKGIAERSPSTVVVEESIVEGVILPAYYEFEYPDDFKAFMDSCIEYSQKEDMDALAGLCGYGGTNQDTVKYIKECCMDGIGMAQYSQVDDEGPTIRKLWHYSFWYEGYRCVLYFVDGEGTHYEWIESWLIPDNGKGYAVGFYPGDRYSGDIEKLTVMNCENGLFEGEFVTKTIISGEDEDEVFLTQGTAKHGLLGGVVDVGGDRYSRYENGRIMEEWRANDPSDVIDIDGYYLNLPDTFFTVAQRRCRYEQGDGGMIWDPF